MMPEYLNTCVCWRRHRGGSNAKTYALVMATLARTADGNAEDAKSNNAHDTRTEGEGPRSWFRNAPDERHIM